MYSYDANVSIAANRYDYARHTILSCQSAFDQYQHDNDVTCCLLYTLNEVRFIANQVRAHTSKENKMFIH